MLGFTGVLGDSLFSVMHGWLVTSSLVREATEKELANYSYRFGQKEETYNIVAVHRYFRRLILIFQYYASVHHSLALHCFSGP
jgi:photosystem II P680 reaction center D1 protein